MKNIWGNTPAGGDESGDNYVVGRRGALSTKSKNLGDGFWCPVCYDNGKYVWANEDAPTSKKWPYCGNCKTPYADMDRDKINELMKIR